jgi:hypothetical protein
MVVRIRFVNGPKLGQKRQMDRRAAQLAAALLSPAALVSFVLAGWRIAADLKWTNSFAIDRGLFSHWQIWMAAASLLQLCSRMLNRYGRDKDAAAPASAKSVI